MRLGRLSLFPLSRHRDQWSHVLLRCAEAIYDSAECVRSAAIRALCKLLNSDYDNIAASVGVEHTSRLVEAVIHAGSCDMDQQTRCIYSFTLNLLVGRYTDWLRPADADRLIQPLVDLFNSYRHEYHNCCFSLSADQLIVY